MRENLEQKFGVPEQKKFPMPAAKLPITLPRPLNTFPNCVTIGLDPTI